MGEKPTNGGRHSSAPSTGGHGICWKRALSLGRPPTSRTFAASPAANVSIVRGQANMKARLKQRGNGFKPGDCKRQFSRTLKRLRGGSDETRYQSKGGIKNLKGIGGGPLTAGERDEDIFVKERLRAPCHNVNFPPATDGGEENEGTTRGRLTKR